MFLTMQIYIGTFNSLNFKQEYQIHLNKTGWKVKTSNDIWRVSQRPRCPELGDTANSERDICLATQTQSTSEQVAVKKMLSKKNIIPLWISGDKTQTEKINIQTTDLASIL